MRVLRSQYLQLQQGEGLAGSSCLENTAPCQQVIGITRQEGAPITDRRFSVPPNLLKNNTVTPSRSSCSDVETNCLNMQHQTSSSPTILNQSMVYPKTVSYTTPSQQLDNTSNYETVSYSEYNNLSITLRNIPEYIKVKVHVHPVDMDNVWLSRIYRRYENDLWKKSPREPESRYKKWYFNCLLCHKTLKAFETIKSHLNAHLNLYPFVCKLCDKPYTNRGEAIKHLKKILRTQCLKLQQKVDDSGTDQNEKVIKPMPKKCSTASQTNTTAKNTTNASHSNVEINSQSTISRRISHGSSSTSYSITSQEEHENNGDYYETTSYSEYRNISITLRNIPENIKVKVHVHPVDMDNVWLSRVYRSYENDLWHKSPREPQSRKKKWYYNCLLCHKPLMAFETLKYHLNRHLELYPFVCKVCGRPHTSRNKAVKHLTKAHCIVKDYKCFIGN